VFLGYFYFVLSVQVQLIAWKDCPQNDLSCVSRGMLSTYSLTIDIISSARMFIPSVSVITLWCR